MPVPSDDFYRIKKLPPYVFAVINELRDRARANNIDVVDMGMGNPDGATPQAIVDKLIEVAPNPINHRYSVSRGIADLRHAIVDRYRKQYSVSLDPESEAIVTIGAKDALAHLLFAIIGPGDVVVSPNPAYPIHQYGVIMAEGEACMLPMPDPATFLSELKKLYRTSAKKPKVILISFPHNPTTLCVDLDFMREVVALAREYGTYIIHDFAYAELGFDGYRPPSILQVEGAAEYAVEIYSMTKSYNMAGWRVGFCLGNRKLIAALARIKSYLDYGNFQPIQLASVVALNDCQDEPAKIRNIYNSRRDTLIRELRQAGWVVEPPKGSMFVWAPLPEPFRHLGSLEFAKLLMQEAHVAVSPGIGFGPMGEGFVRFSLIEDEKRIHQAAEKIANFFQQHEALAALPSLQV
jgi:alanine-synthesizing transaminase